MLNWQIKTFYELSGSEVYKILKLRQDVFILEQQCLYSDADNIDQQAMHILLIDEVSQQLKAYCRLVPAGLIYQEAAIGRVVLASSQRRKGTAKLMLKKAIDCIQQYWQIADIRISAQYHLLELYQSVGFEIASAPYDEDGIEHIEMLLKE